MATSVVLRGIAGFGPRHQLRTDRSLSASEDLPVAVTAVDSADKIAALADRVVELTTRGLVTLERAGSAGAGGDRHREADGPRRPRRADVGAAHHPSLV